MKDTIAVIGAGVIGGSVVKSLLKSGYDGKIIVAGDNDVVYDPITQEKQLGLIRYNTDGTRDVSFGAGGAAGSFVSGVGWETIGPNNVYLLAAVMAFSAFIVAWVWIRPVKVR